MFALQKKPEFDPRLKNPCWLEPLYSTEPYANNTYASFSPSARQMLKRLTAELAQDVTNERDVGDYSDSADTNNDVTARDDVTTTRLRCLPYFLVIGQPKCGSTDLFWRLAKHPDITTPPIKELHWWSRSRQGAFLAFQEGRGICRK